MIARVTLGAFVLVPLAALALLILSGCATVPRWDATRPALTWERR